MRLGFYMGEIIPWHWANGELIYNLAELEKREEIKKKSTVREITMKSTRSSYGTIDSFSRDGYKEIKSENEESDDEYQNSIQNDNCKG